MIAIIKEFSEQGSWQCPISFEIGYNKAKELYCFTKQDMLDLIQGLKDYTREGHVILGYDEREPEEFLKILNDKNK